MKKRGLLIGVCVISLFFLGACSMVKEVTKKKIPVSEIVKDGKVDVEKAKEAGYVSYAEKEKLGYFTVDSVSNKKVQKEALAEKDTIYKNLLPVIKENTGREDIEILGMRAIFPYPAVDVRYKSKEAPYIYGSYLYGVEDGGPVAKDKFANTSGTIAEQTVEGLYTMIYQDKVKEMDSYLEKKYPRYEGFYGNGKDDRMISDKSIRFTITTLIGEKNVEKKKQSVNEIYKLYQENPNRTNEEWQKIFVEKDVKILMYVILMTKDSNVIPTDKDMEKFKQDIKTNELFAGYYQKGIALSSNLIDTKSNQSLVSLSDLVE